MSNDREADWTAPPTTIEVPEPGPVLYCQVMRQGALVGAVWAAETPGTRPAAGIVITKAADPLIQGDLGLVTLRMRNRDFDPREFLAHLTERRNGWGDSLLVGSADRAGSLAEVYRLMGHDLG